MERLTEWNREHTHGQVRGNCDAITRLAEYEDAEEQGLLLRLPCKVGDKVYEASKFWDKVLERTVASIVLSSENHIYVRNGCGDSFEFGVDVFLTQEEAEQALKQMGE